MARIKITGYINVEDLEPEEVDLDDATGLSSEGYENLIMGEKGIPLQTTGMDDVEVELVD